TREVSTLGTFTGASAPAIARLNGRLGGGRGTRAAGCDGQRGSALGRSVDPGADQNVSRAGADPAATAPLHSAPRIPRTVVTTETSYAYHAQSAELAQCAHYCREVSGKGGVVGEDHRSGSRTHRRSAVVRGGTNSCSARERR